MSRRRKSARQRREEMLQLCGEINDDDGIDPLEWSKNDTQSQKNDRKTWQLCRQVTRTLEFVLADCDDPLVQNMDLLAVAPHPDCSCLRIEVMCHDRSNSALAGQALQAQIGRLRFEIGRSIHRKRVPNLVFSVSMPEVKNDGS